MAEENIFIKAKKERAARVEILHFLKESEDTCQESDCQELIQEVRRGVFNFGMEETLTFLEKEVLEAGDHYKGPTKTFMQRCIDLLGK